MHRRFHNICRPECIENTFFHSYYVDGGCTLAFTVTTWMDAVHWLSLLLRGWMLYIGLHCYYVDGCCTLAFTVTTWMDAVHWLSPLLHTWMLYALQANLLSSEDITLMVIEKFIFLKLIFYLSIYFYCIF